MNKSETEVDVGVNMKTKKKAKCKMCLTSRGKKNELVVKERTASTQSVFFFHVCVEQQNGLKESAA